MSRFICRLSVLSAFLLSSALWAGTSGLPIEGLKIKISPNRGDKVNLGGITAFTSQNLDGVFIRWSAAAKSAEESEPWPVYKLVIDKGGVTTDTLGGVTTMTHPLLWVKGVIKLNRNGLLWMNPEILRPENVEKEFAFEPGFLHPSFFYFEKSNPDRSAPVVELRRLSTLFLPTGEAKPKGEVGQFFEEFSHVKVQARKNSSVLVKGQKKSVPVAYVANRYVTYEVLDDVENPLILSLRFSPIGAPDAVRDLLVKFQELLEYEVTSID